MSEGLKDVQSMNKNQHELNVISFVINQKAIKQIKVVKDMSWTSKRNSLSSSQEALKHLSKTKRRKEGDSTQSKKKEGQFPHNVLPLFPRLINQNIK